MFKSDFDKLVEEMGARYGGHAKAWGSGESKVDIDELEGIEKKGGKK